MVFRLNHRQVEAFRAVFLTGSMTAAGELIGVSQPAVSRLIRDLEAMIGLRLFNRQGTRITPTADASILFQEVDRSFRGLDRVARAAQDLSNRRGSALRITTTYAISQFFLPPVLARFRKLWPEVAITLHTASSLEIVNLMEMQHYDLGIAIRTPGSVDLRFEPLASFEAVCAMHTAHPYAKKQVVTVDDLDRQSLLSLPINSEIQSRINSIIEAANIAPVRVLETTFSSTLCSLIAKNLGLAIVDPFTADGFREYGVISRRFKPAINYDLNLVFSTHRARSKVTENAIDLLREQIYELSSAWVQRLAKEVGGAQSANL